MSILFFLIVLTITIIHAKVDTILIQKFGKINHNLEASIYTALCLFFAYLLTKEYTIKWGLFCAITCLLIRAGWFDFTLNLMRGKSLWYVSSNADGNYSGNKESFYDDLLAKIKNLIHPNDIRISSFFLSLMWLIFLIKFQWI